MEEIYKSLASQTVWSQYGTSDAASFEVTELYLKQSTGTTTTRHRTIADHELDSWLNEPRHRDAKGEIQRTLFRLVWVNRSPDTKQMDMAADTLSTILEAFDLHLAHQYGSSCFTGITALPPKLVDDEGTTRQSHTFCTHPKLAVVWSHVTHPTSAPSPAVNQRSTNTVVFSNRARISVLRRLLETPWQADLAAHAAFPALLCSLLLSQEVHSTQDGIKVDLREVEVRTGHHRFGNRRERPATGELGELSAQMSGCATKLASVTRKLKTLEELCDFVGADAAPPPALPEPLLPSRAAGLSVTEILANSTKLIRHRIKMQTMDNDYILQRVQIQIDALFNLITQSDGLISLQIARASQLTAISSQRDSSSMKTLAVVTMFFLPGSFVSALFATPLFDFDLDNSSGSGGEAATSSSSGPLAVRTRAQFPLYWAVTVPLTVATFVLYFMWLLFQKSEQTRRSRAAEIELVEQTHLAEVKFLSMKRGTIFEKSASRLDV